MEHLARVVRPDLDPSRRILAVSDIHGNLPFLRGLLRKARFSPHDILVLVGDMLEKGQESLALLRYLMELEKTHTIYPLCGNCDGFVLRFFEEDALDQIFFPFYFPKHPESILLQMGREAGVEDWHDLPRLRRVLRARFAPEWDFLRRMPTVLETPRHVFVHGGVPSLHGMEQLSRWACMKNDNFLGQGRSFPKWVVVGHWPVTLYHPCIPSAAPLFSPGRHIISIDGGCVLKADGQLNALVIPGAESEDFSVISYDGLPTVVALDPQEENIASVNIRWGRSALNVLRPGEELSLCRHLETGRVLWVLTRYLRRQGDRVWCEDSTDYRLSVSPGDRLHLVQATSRGFLCKKEGVTGWYFGRVSDII